MYNVQINRDWIKINKTFNKKINISVNLLKYDKNYDINILLLSGEPPPISGITFDKLKCIYKNWDYILTWNDDILKLPNAILFEFGTSWISLDEEKLLK